MKSNQSQSSKVKKFLNSNYFNYNNLIIVLFGLAILSVSVLSVVAFAIYQKKAQIAQQSNIINKPQILGAQDIAEIPDLVPKNDLPMYPIQPVNEMKNLYQADIKKVETQKTPNLENDLPKTPDNSQKEKADEIAETNLRPKENPQTNQKTLSPADFHSILLSHAFENTLPGEVELSATGNSVADDRINQIAQSRGFQLWPRADESRLVDYNSNIKLQPLAKNAFIKMQEAAKRDGVILGLVSGYRSQLDQNLIFKPRFEALEMAELGGYYTPEELAKGEADDLIYRAMSLTAPPGYSRHHTGYTLDLSDLSPDNTSSVFNGSKAFKWLSDNNYANARKFGFIPSYPEGLKNVGPQPEAWEYVWVGTESL
jgi:LAS superfamily LD-carboxypeptidase LdcB